MAVGARLDEANWSTNDGLTGITLGIQVDMPSQTITLPGGNHNARFVERLSPLSSGLHSVSITLEQSGHELQRHTSCIDVRP